MHICSKIGFSFGIHWPHHSWFLFFLPLLKAFFRKRSSTNTWMHTVNSTKDRQRQKHYMLHNLLFSRTPVGTNEERTWYRRAMLGVQNSYGFFCGYVARLRAYKYTNELRLYRYGVNCTWLGAVLGSWLYVMGDGQPALTSRLKPSKHCVPRPCW